MPANVGGGGGICRCIKCECVWSGTQAAEPLVTLVHLHFNPLAYRAVITFSSCLVNDTSWQGFKQLESLFGSTFLLFSYESRRGSYS